jgi:hypothetical protein
MDNPEQEEYQSLPDPSPLEEPPSYAEPVSQNTTPALVVNIYSWATPVAGVVMLVVGLLLGYFGRPLLVSSAGSSTQPTQVSQAGSGGVTTPTADVMAYLVSQTHHIKGNQNAPVTIIEFSDYQ